MASELLDRVRAMLRSEPVEESHPHTATDTTIAMRELMRRIQTSLKEAKSPASAVSGARRANPHRR
jgi:hypothetical protein